MWIPSDAFSAAPSTHPRSDHTGPAADVWEEAVDHLLWWQEFGGHPGWRVWGGDGEEETHIIHGHHAALKSSKLVYPQQQDRS